EGERVQERRPDLPPADDGREVGGGVSGARTSAADGPEDARGRMRVGALERVGARVRDDRVEDEPRDAARVRDRVSLGDERPVRHAVEDDLVDAEGPAKRLEVLDR